MTWVLDSTRIKQTFLRPTSDKGTSVPFLATGFRRFCVTAVWGFLFLAAFVAQAAFTPAPPEAVKALKVTKGKPFSSGVVFVDGRFIEPPYVVERYGNVIRINKIQVTNPIYEWSEIARTQSGAVVTRTEAAPSPRPEVAAPAKSAPPPPRKIEEDDDPLEALFDDRPAKRAPVAKSAPPVAKKPPAPTVTTKVRLDGEFEMNAKVQMMVNKMNAARTEIDASLRRGCFICFGSTYSRVLGDKSMAIRILQHVPEIMKRNSEYGPFAAEIRKAGFIYFPPNLVKELYNHRIDYPVLQRRWKKVFEEQEFNSMLENAGVPGY